jgi:hypothetical protein
MYPAATHVHREPVLENHVVGFSHDDLVGFDFLLVSIRRIPSEDIPSD